MGTVHPGKRIRELYLATVEHAGTLSHVGPYEAAGPHEASAKLREIQLRDEALVKGTAIIDHGKPIYRLWKMIGSMHEEDLE